MNQERTYPPLSDDPEVAALQEAFRLCEANPGYGQLCRELGISPDRMPPKARDAALALLEASADLSGALGCTLRVQLSRPPEDPPGYRYLIDYVDSAYVWIAGGWQVADMMYPRAGRCVWCSDVGTRTLLMAPDDEAWSVAVRAPCPLASRSKAKHGDSW